MPVDDKVKKMAVIVQRSTNRMRNLIENILDFARGHLGNGIKLTLSNDEPLEEILSQIADELRSVSPDYKIDIVFNLTRTVSCDARRMAQLLSNLLSNALTYGKAGEAVQVLVKTDNEGFLLSVTNQGDKIEDQIMSRLFQPFYRGDIEPSQRGLGLGLYIASEIAKAHKGQLTVNSTEDFTCFTFRMAID